MTDIIDRIVYEIEVVATSALNAASEALEKVAESEPVEVSPVENVEVRHGAKDADPN